MRLNTSVVIASITLLIGITFAKSYLWIPATVLGAGVCWLALGPWAASEKRGSSAVASEAFALLVNLIGLWATFGQVACLVLIGIWFFA